MSTPTEQRELVLGAAERTCPRCGATRESDQEYCVECGLRLPVVTGRLPSLRRRWIRRVGWYPGDWVWISLLTLAIAVAGAAVAITVTHHRDAAAGRTVVAPTTPGLSVREPGAVAKAPVDTSTLPQAPEPRTATSSKHARSSVRAWPAGVDGWTIVIASYPKANGRPAALQTAARAARTALANVGVLDSSAYPSLQPGYFVVFTGVYASQTAADVAVATVHSAGFSGAYARQVAR